MKNKYLFLTGLGLIVSNLYHIIGNQLEWNTSFAKLGLIWFLFTVFLHLLFGFEFIKAYLREAKNEK